MSFHSRWNPLKIGGYVKNHRFLIYYDEKSSTTPVMICGNAKTSLLEANFTTILGERSV